MTAPLLEVRDLVRTYRQPGEGLFARATELRAVDGVGFRVEAGRSFAIVGESGSGKSTLARTVVALETPSAGDVLLRGESLFAMSAARLRAARRDLKMVFQDPYESLDPRLAVGASIADPLAVAEPALARTERIERVAEALAAVGLRPADAGKYPHEFSGGQRQRIAIARALVTRPALIVADEPVSALDVSVQAQVLNLMQDLRERFGVAYLLISHNLAVVRHVADEVAVMQAGRFVEQGSTAELFRAPQHPYTRALLSAMLPPRPRRADRGASA